METLERICDDIASVRREGHEVVLVSSGAIALGLGRLGLHARPSGAPELRAAAAVGQVALMTVYERLAEARGMTIGQLLLIPSDFADRHQYLHARETLHALLGRGVLPVLNENDALSNQQLRYGDNDKVAALVSNLIGAELLILLTDKDGLYTSDPTFDPNASLVEEVIRFDRLALSVGGVSSEVGSGGMASKLQAAKMASWSGVETRIANAAAPAVVSRAVRGDESVGTRIVKRPRRLGARRLWIAFASPPQGSVTVDDGAKRALVTRGKSLLPAGVVGVDGTFDEGDTISVLDLAGAEIAKGLTRLDANEVQRVMGTRSMEHGMSRSFEVVHRDDLVVLVDDPDV
jgi:glutamate 5-kinase